MFECLKCQFRVLNPGINLCFTPFFMFITLIPCQKNMFYCISLFFTLITYFVAQLCFILMYYESNLNKCTIQLHYQVPSNPHLFRMIK